MASEDIRIYQHHTLWLLEEVEANLRATSTELLTKSPTVFLEGNNLLAIAKHAVGVTRAYVLGMGCGLQVSRDRSTEFVAEAAAAAEILEGIASLRREIPEALAALQVSRLDVSFRPERSLYGTGEIRDMTPRDAIVNNIRHLGIHLGEIRLTRSLLEA